MIPHRTVPHTLFGNLQPAEQPVTAASEDAVATKLNARVVEFIAKPGKADELRALLCRAVTPLLQDRAGFIRTIILTKHEEQRGVVMITFWSMEERAASDPWEEMHLVREILSPVIDARSRARTYDVDLADLTDTTEARSQPISLQIC